MTKLFHSFKQFSALVPKYLINSTTVPSCGHKTKLAQIKHEHYENTKLHKHVLTDSQNIHSLLLLSRCYACFPWHQGKSEFTRLSKIRMAHI